MSIPPPIPPEYRPKKNAPRRPKIRIPIFYLILAAVLGYMLYTGRANENGNANKEVAYSVAQKYIEQNKVKEVIVDKTDEEIRLRIDGKYIREIFNAGTDKVGPHPTVSAKIPSVSSTEKYLVEHYQGKVSYERSSHIWTNILTSILPILLLVFLWFYLLRGMGGGGMGGNIFGVGKSKAKLFDKENAPGTHTTFADVAGQEGAKQEVQEIVDFLKNPAKYTELGGKIPKGALLVGPPGTGKTLLAKAVAGEANVPFFSMSGSDFVEMFVGVGASRVRDLFQKAKEKSPCIVFIDEIDAIGRARGKTLSMGGNDERENTLNQLLTEMDGFGTNSGVIILAATNRAEILDPALLRAGRFDRQIHVDLPELSERVAIFHVHLKPLKLEEGLDIDFLARQTPGFSGADIANVCNEAALIAARHDHKTVCKQDFLDAVDRIIGGLERTSKVMTADEKRSIAIHEAGHASVSWLLQYANPLVKVTIVPRGQALGAAWYLPEERSITTREQMLDEMCATLAGRAAEELFIGHISSGALNDLERVTKRAYGMVAYLGMADGDLANLCFYNNNEYNFTKPYSERTAERIDAAVSSLVAQQYERAKSILTEAAAKHGELAQLLIEREVIFTEDVERIFGPRPWKSRADVLMSESTEPTPAAESEDAAQPEAQEESSTPA